MALLKSPDPPLKDRHTAYELMITVMKSEGVCVLISLTDQ